MPKICFYIKNKCTACDKTVGATEGVMFYNLQNKKLEVFCGDCSAIMSTLINEIKKKINERSENE